MLKGALAVLAGLVCGVAMVFIVESGGHLLYPPPEALDQNNSQALQTIMQSIPQSWPAWVVASVFFGFALWTMHLIPHPDWMAVGATLVTLASAISAAYFWAKA